MRVNPWRLAGLGFAVAVLAVAALVIANGVSYDAMVAGVRGKNIGRIRLLLRIRPGLASAKVMPQGSMQRGRWRGRYVIHDAVSTGDVAVVETLAAHGADLGVRLDGDSLLHIAAADGNLEMMSWLIRKGADVNDRNTCKGCEHEGRSPLHAAQHFRDREASELLLSLGADANAADAAGRTPLHASAADGSSGGAMVLCANGADPTRRDHRGQTPSDVALTSDQAGRGSLLPGALPGELAGWLRPGGGCQQLAARARPGHPASASDVVEIWQKYVCERDSAACASQSTP